MRSVFLFTPVLIFSWHSDFCVVDSQIYICDFHREQAWERWLAKSSNGVVGNKQTILAKLRAIARARTEPEYLEKLGELKENEEWKSNSSLRNYITKTWLPQHKVHCQKFYIQFYYENVTTQFPRIPVFVTEMGMGVSKRPVPHNH